MPTQGIGDASKMLPSIIKRHIYGGGNLAAAGAAALLGSQYNESGARHWQPVGQRDQIFQFTDKCVSGGMVNAARQHLTRYSTALWIRDIIEADGYFENLKSAKIGGMDAEIVAMPEAVSQAPMEKSYYP